MLTKEEARGLVVATLEVLSKQDQHAGAVTDWVILDEQTIEKPWGWVFFYTSARYLRTRDRRHAVAGNAPYIVNRHTGELRVTGTARPLLEYIADYERGLAQGSPLGLPAPGQVAWLLNDLSSQLGYTMAARDEARFARLVQLGPAAFADAVLTAEGLDPELETHQRQAVRAFVAERFARWVAGGAA